MKKLILLSFALATALVFADCKKKKGLSDEEELNASFDKSAMFSNYADNLILPNLQSAKSALDSFALAFDDFIQNKTAANLATARQKFIAAHIRYEHISLFELGPAENEIVRANFDTYPTDSVIIKNNIASGSYNLSVVSNLAAKGLPAIDWLLFGKNSSDNTIIALFDTDTYAANRKNYVKDCIGEMQTKLNNIIAGWNSGYRGSFVSSTGPEIGSSLGLLVNQISFEVDLLKNSKIGIPLGKKSAGTLLPEKCEAYYANTISVRLAKECLANIENAYLGRSRNGTDGSGLDDYLDALKVQHNSGTLNDAIKAQFALAKSKLQLVNEPLSAEVMANTATVDAAYVEMVKLLVLLKTDMPSAMGVVITYQDGDGD